MKRIGLIAAAAYAALAACGGDAPAPEPAASPAAYDAARAAVSGIEWSPTLERHVASLLSERPFTEEGLEAVIAPARPALDALDEAAKAPWVLPPGGKGRVSRDDWEAAAWLAYGDARLALGRGDAAAARARALTAARVAHRLGQAEGADLADRIVAFGLAEAAALQAQRLSGLAPGLVASDDFAAALPADEDDQWSALLRAEAEAVTGRIDAMADDPVRHLGFSAEAVPPRLRDAAPDRLLDPEATKERAVGLFLAAADRSLADCDGALSLPEPPMPDPAGPNLAGRLFLADTATALRQLDDRRCLTEAARRAGVMALVLRDGGRALPDRLPRAPGLADPMTGAPFAYDAAGGTLRSAGRDRLRADGPGQGPFDDDEPTWYLDARPLI